MALYPRIPHPRGQDKHKSKAQRTGTCVRRCKRLRICTHFPCTVYGGDFASDRDVGDGAFTQWCQELALLVRGIHSSCLLLPSNRARHAPPIATNSALTALTATLDQISTRCFIFRGVSVRVRTGMGVSRFTRKFPVRWRAAEDVSRNVEVALFPMPCIMIERPDWIIEETKVDLERSTARH